MRFSPIDRALNAIDSIDKTTEYRGLLQELRPVVKILASALFIITVVSFGKYEIKGLLPYFPMLAFLTAASGISFKSVFLKILKVSPFVIFIGVLNPFFDSSVVALFGFGINGGLVSFISILLKFVLTAWCGFLLIYSTRFTWLIDGFRRLKIPAVLAGQFYFLFRYMRLLLTEASALWRARQARMGETGTFDMKIYATLAGSLAIRSFRRSSRIHWAMLARGFDGELPYFGSDGKLKKGDILFLFSVVFCCLFFRFFVEF